MPAPKDAILEDWYLASAEPQHKTKDNDCGATDAYDILRRFQFIIYLTFCIKFDPTHLIQIF
jgi:hypothetical protein